MEEHVVIIYAHPDDECFGTAGTIIEYREKGIPVTYVCGTLGEMGRNMGSPTFANRETLPTLRKKELEDACEYLDIDLRLLGYRDKTIEFEDRTEVATHIKEILDELKPTLVITHYPPYAVHPDHNALGAAVIEAVGMYDAASRPELWATAISHNFEEYLGAPHIIHDVSPIFDQKLEAIMQHTSQAQGMLERMSGTSQDSIELRKAWEKRLGKEQFFIWNYEDEAN